MLIPVTAHAYIDPGTGAMIIQAIVAVFAGVAYFFKTNWNKIKGIKDEKNEDSNSESVDSNKDEINKAS